MAMLQSINGVAIDGVNVKQPSDVGVERYNLTKSGRVASGKMTMELIAKKRKLTIQYEVIGGIHLERLLSAIDSDAMFFPVTWQEMSNTYTMTAYVGGIKYKRFRSDGVWYWKNLTFDLIEQ